MSVSFWACIHKVYLARYTEHRHKKEEPLSRAAPALRALHAAPHMVEGLPSLSLADLVDTLFELLTDLEERKFLWWNWDLLTSLWVTAFVCTVLLNYEATEASDLDSATVNERVPHFAIHKVNNLFSLNNVDTTALSQFFDQF